MKKYVIALAGNPNVGKSTVFNALTGLNQHTGNWPGKTVAKATGICKHAETEYMIVDLPGTYSILSHSQEEEVARDFLCFGNPDITIVVCDATCLERNLNLVLQVLEITPNVILCLNLMDEAKKKNITINCSLLQKLLGVPVIATSARTKIGMDNLLHAIDIMSHKQPQQPRQISYAAPIEYGIRAVHTLLEEQRIFCPSFRWICVKLLEQDTTFLSTLEKELSLSLQDNTQLIQSLKSIQCSLNEQLGNSCQINDSIVCSLILEAQEIASKVVCKKESRKEQFDERLDSILTNRITGIPIMLLLLLGVFWLTIIGANYPSNLLANLFSYLQTPLSNALLSIPLPPFLYHILIDGIYRVVTWVVAVMLPPMAIFFPLFTILEDFGYLPRVAYNLDHYFKRCNACGKQALTMCQGFGCNAAGVIGCRIIDSPRERLIAVITNNFVPCNGRFPTLIAIITMFFTCQITNITQPILSSILLTGVIIFSVLMSFLVSKLLSLTILKGIPSSFTLELPPYRRPQIGKVILHSIFDRTLFVLSRAIAVAAPAGLILWLLANISINNSSILTLCSNYLDPFARLFGLDGIILMAFILGFPANEIVIPIALMAYLSRNSLIEIQNLSTLKEILISNGWTWQTAICVMIFSLMHWPCSTTCLTIKKETGSLKWTLISILTPTFLGLTLCFLFYHISNIILFLLKI